MNSGTILDKLAPFSTWKLEHLSATTFPYDITVRCPVAKSMVAKLTQMLRDGVCYRCRIAKGPFFYAETPFEAVDLAVAGASGCKGASS